jgi:hypothetical protein
MEEGGVLVGTREMGDAVAGRIYRHSEKELDKNA